MENTWTRVATFGSLPAAQLHQGMLENEGIVVVMQNEQDSSYFFGDIYLYVQEADAARALELLKPQNEIE